MADIIVWFPRRGGVVVFRHEQAVIVHETIAWHIVSENPGVKKARIRFATAADKFFPTRKGRLTRLVKSLDPGTSSTVIWGIAPAPRRLPRSSKYTVEGLDRRGTTVVQLDPVIIIVPPSPGPIGAGRG